MEVQREVDRRAVPVWVVLVGLSAVAWIITLAEARHMGNGPGTMGMAFPLFLGMWTAMMAAMMWPGIGPVAVAETSTPRSSLGVRSLAASTFALGFLVAWALYGVATFGALAALGRLVDRAPDVARWLGVGILVVAGGYQLTPWKQRALRHCRHPMGDHADGDAGRAFFMGARDGAMCVGCCWAYMSVFLVTGVMSIPAMVGLTAAIVAEKLVPDRALGPVVRVAGLALLSLAVVGAVDPSLLPGIHGGMAGMMMGA